MNNLSSKPHYHVLDALRGVASIMVLAFHICEAHATGHLDQVINHGYLAVDFFFLLSGFVIGYAYDDRWNTLSVGEFFKRRLIRLQPMVIIGMIIGAICFYFQASGLWPSISQTPGWKVILTMLLGFTLLPMPLSMDIRGWAEMHPLNGPGWSLLFEYIVNILYGSFIRKFSKLALTVLVSLSAINLVYYAVTNSGGDLIGGWSLDPAQLRIGITRVMYPFFAGLLLSRTAKIIQIKNAFLWSSLLVIIVLAIPRIGGTNHLWMNGLYDALSIIFIFPLIIYLGAGGQTKSNLEKKVCKFFGDISYPLYITHYPLIYIYTGWVYDNKLSLQQAFPYSLLVFFSAILVAYLSLKLYDEPVRKWLTKKFLTKQV